MLVELSTRVWSVREGEGGGEGDRVEVEWGEGVKVVESSGFRVRSRKESLGKVDRRVSTCAWRVCMCEEGVLWGGCHCACVMGALGRVCMSDGEGMNEASSVSRGRHA